MLVFAGLGNPGPAYAQHRHNVGFMAVDVIHHAHGFSPWKARFQGLTADGRHETRYARSQCEALGQPIVDQRAVPPLSAER